MFKTQAIRTAALSFAAAMLAALPAAGATDTLKLGMSAPMSGAAAAWGLGFEWAAERAAEAVNAGGGVTVDGTTYTFEIVTYDNKYNASEGAKVAQTLLNRDGVRYIIGSLGTAPVKAMQSLTERNGVLLFTTAWGMSVKGPDFPLTFTQINTPAEVLPQLYGYITEQHPGARTVAMLNPNDATGQDTEKFALKAWADLGVEVVSSDWYERGTSEFQPTATKLANLDPDIIDLSATPPSDAAQVLKNLQVLGWDGIKVIGAGTSGPSLVRTGGDAVEGTYMGLAADFDGADATEIQRTLNAGAKAALDEPLNVITIGSWDAIMALKAGMEAAGSIEPQAIAAVLPEIIFEASYGLSAFGSADVYGTPQQILVPTIVTQIQDGRAVELKRVNPPELRQRLDAAR